MGLTMRSARWAVLFFYLYFGMSAQAMEFVFDFRESTHGFTHGFADYPRFEEDFYELQFSYEELPANLGAGKALFISGNNHSDDLFMFIKKRLSGLDANTHYEAEISADFASNSPSQAMGIGGGPGCSVYIKTGISEIEPFGNVEEASGSETILRMNIDIGSQSQGGTQAQVIGDIGIPGSDSSKYMMVSRSNLGNSFRFTSDELGNAWFFIGSDSGFEGATSLYYTKITVRLSRQ